MQFKESSILSLWTTLQCAWRWKQSWWRHRLFGQLILHSSAATSRSRCRGWARPPPRGRGPPCLCSRTPWTATTGLVPLAACPQSARRSSPGTVSGRASPPRAADPSSGWTPRASCPRDPRAPGPALRPRPTTSGPWSRGPRPTRWSSAPTSRAPGAGSPWSAGRPSTSATSARATALGTRRSSAPAARSTSATAGARSWRRWSVDSRSWRRAQAGAPASATSGSSTSPGHSSCRPKTSPRAARH
mmetsp:Transcript_80359/g.194839  ORF Transcript_80359/g.194839 Transcript_80359/m.194839 type:complete len:245 (-) Transcript_80359:369-1103(-)